MNDLRNYYRTRLAGLAVAVALLAVFISEMAVPCFTDGLLAKTVMWFTSRPAIVVFLVLGELAVRKVLWRIERAEFDFTGKWEGETRYTTVHVGSAFVPFSVSHSVKMEQDCLSFALAPTSAKPFINWGSLALQLVDKDTLRYAYWVTYSNDSRFPEGTVFGYEEMRVTLRDTRRRPLEITGEFFHCVQGQVPVYSGNVTFKRIVKRSR